jgi:hypothetical protein
MQINARFTYGRGIVGVTWKSRDFLRRTFSYGDAVQGKYFRLIAKETGAILEEALTDGLKVFHLAVAKIFK